MAEFFVGTMFGGFVVWCVMEMAADREWWRHHHG